MSLAVPKTAHSNDEYYWPQRGDAQTLKQFTAARNKQGVPGEEHRSSTLLNRFDIIHYVALQIESHCSN